MLEDGARPVEVRAHPQVEVRLGRAAHHACEMEDNVGSAEIARLRHQVDRHGAHPRIGGHVRGGRHQVGEDKLIHVGGLAAADLDRPGEQPPGEQGPDKPGATGDNDPHSAALLSYEEFDHSERSVVPPPPHQLLPVTDGPVAGRVEPAYVQDDGFDSARRARPSAYAPARSSPR